MSVYVWEPKPETWRLLTRREKSLLWEFRQRPRERELRPEPEPGPEPDSGGSIAGACGRAGALQLRVHLAGGEPAGEEGGEHTLLGQAQPVHDGGRRVPSHVLVVLLPPVRSCKPQERL